MRLLLIWMFCVMLAPIFSACNSNSVTATTSDNNATPDSLTVLSHSLFQLQNGQPSLNGWTFHPAGSDDTLDFEADAPPGAGTWSYKLHTGDFPPTTNTLTRNFTGLSSGIYSLTAWVHLKYDLPAGSFPEGWISIIKLSGGNTTVATQPTTPGVAWHSVTLLDTLSLKSTDTVMLLLSAGARTPTQHGNPVWVDDITFKRVQ